MICVLEVEHFLIYIIQVTHYQREDGARTIFVPGEVNWVEFVDQLFPRDVPP